MKRKPRPKGQRSCRARIFLLNFFVFWFYFLSIYNSWPNFEIILNALIRDQKFSHFVIENLQFEYVVVQQNGPS